MPNQQLNVAIMPKGSLRLEWEEAKEKISNNSHRLQEEIYERSLDDADNWLFFLGFCDKAISISPSVDHWQKFVSIFVERLVKIQDLEILRHKVSVDPPEDGFDKFLESAFLMTGSEYLDEAVLMKIWAGLTRFFVTGISAHDGTVESFLKRYTPDVHLAGRIFFNLVENKNNPDRPFAFLATYSTRLNRQGKSKHLPLKHALAEYEDTSDKLLDLLSTVHTAAKQSHLISGLIETGELFHPLAWSAKEAFAFLKEIPVYEKSGILCRIPNWWRQGVGASGVSLNIEIGAKKPSFVGKDALLNFDAKLLLGDVRLTRAEAEKLLVESEGLAFIKNKWVAVDREKLRQTLNAYEKAKKMMDENGLSINDAIRMHLKPGRAFNLEESEIEIGVSNGAWLKSIINKLRNPDLTSETKPGKGFKARLRKYQQKGLNWLWFLHSMQFGACLADDMGLGKTVQLLAFLSAKKTRKQEKPSLLVIPASLIPNWMDEIKRFFPSLKYFVAHPAAHSKKSVLTKTKKVPDSVDLVITTYALAQKYEWLKSYSWSYVILDEAQAIKNPGAKQTRAVKSLKAQNRIIMTGTPMENRIGDLWSLFDFINPGLLGNKNEFTKFSKNLKNDPDGYSRLRKVISPYILRRLKTDKSIISDLPDKVELKSYASLSKKQVVLYQEIVNRLAEKLEESEGIQRKGLILSSLMKFKQLCNHPDQYLGSGKYTETDSGKFMRLREICETIHEKREKVLVFTQFKEIAEPLAAFLENIFRCKGRVLHGSVPVSKRRKIIDQFQGDEYVPFMVLSLKAGGVGLNLTQANHVIHFDRWWNPAVENQATDRAFRIGQKKNVMVHKFLTKGTVEERIDLMLEEKAALSEKIVSKSGESLVTEMDDDKIMDIFKLRLS